MDVDMYITPSEASGPDWGVLFDVRYRNGTTKY